MSLTPNFFDFVRQFYLIIAFAINGVIFVFFEKKIIAYDSAKNPGYNLTVVDPKFDETHILLQALG